MDSVLQSTSNEGTEEHNVLTHGQPDLNNLLHKYSLSQVSIEKPCDDDLFLTLLPQISNFNDIAPYLGFTQPEIEEIQIDKTTERSRKLSMLWKWKSRNGSDATYLAIVKVFLRMRDQNLAEIVLQHIKRSFEHQPQPMDSCIFPENTSSYGNWDRKSAADREQIKNLLFKENEVIRKKFSFLIQNIVDSFESRNVKVKRFKMFLYSYGSIPKPAHVMLLSHFESAVDLDDVFLILCRDYTSWFNIQLLKAIVERFGSEKDEEDMKIYEIELVCYLKRSIFEIPSKSFAPGHENAGLVSLFILLPDDVIPTGEDVNNITRNLSQLLGISNGILQFIGYQNCSILLMFGIPEQLLHNIASQSLIEKYFAFDISKKGYTFNSDVALVLLPESIVMHDVTLTELLKKTNTHGGKVVVRDLDVLTMLESERVSVETLDEMCTEQVKENVEQTNTAGNNKNSLVSKQQIMSEEFAVIPIVEVVDFDELTGQATIIPKTQKPGSISDDDENISKESNVITSSFQHLSTKWSENALRRKLFTQQSDADSAIGSSFEEDTAFFEVKYRNISSVLPPGIVDQSHDTISIQLTPEAGLEVANSLEWEAAIVVSEDYPPSQDSTIFYKGDKIVQVGDRLIHNMTAQEFSEFFQTEAAAGTTLKIVPNIDKRPVESMNIPGNQKLLRRTPSEQAIYDNIKSKINQLISMRPPNAEREIIIPRASNGNVIKMIGGKAVGVFISDVRSDVTQVIPGDQILEINGHSMRGLSLYDANQILRTMSGDLKLTVVENKDKFMHVREQVEVDSLYFRSLVDHTPTSNREMTLKKGSLLRVVNTFVIAPNYWLAGSLDERTGVEPQLKRIPSPSYARKQFGCEAYERVERSDVVFFCRPVCIVGPGGDNVADIISKEDGYIHCESVEQVLAVCVKGSNHAVLSTSDTKKIELLTALQPIVLQMPADGVPLPEFSSMIIDSYLTGEKSFDLAQQAVHQIQQFQSLPIWRRLGAIS